ncbi:MAG: hypothetical protein R3E62_03795 [Pseudomonadales bacterium]
MAPLLKRWRSDNGDMADTSGLPNDLVEVVKSLHERVQQMADHRIDRAQQEFIELNEELRKNSMIPAIRLRSSMPGKGSDTDRGNVSTKGTKSSNPEDIHIKLTRAELQRDQSLHGPLN